MFTEIFSKDFLMKPLAISIASVAALAAASFGVQAQQQPLPQDNAPTTKSAPSGGTGSDRPAAAGGDSTSDRPNRAESSDKPDQKSATKKSEGTNKDGKSAEKPGDSMSKDGKTAEKTGDSASKDGKSAEKTGDSMSKDGKSGDKPKQARVDIKPEQKTVIKQTIVRENIRPQKIDVQVRVGVRIPQSVVLYSLPPTIIEIYPAYRPYKFVMVDDNTILVIDPTDWEIVDVITV